MVCIVFACILRFRVGDVECCAFGFVLQNLFYVCKWSFCILVDGLCVFLYRQFVGMSFDFDNSFGLSDREMAESFERLFRVFLLILSVCLGYFFRIRDLFPPHPRPLSSVSATHFIRMFWAFSSVCSTSFIRIFNSFLPYPRLISFVSVTHFDRMFCLSDAYVLTLGYMCFLMMNRMWFWGFEQKGGIGDVILFLVE